MKLWNSSVLIILTLWLSHYDVHKWSWVKYLRTEVEFTSCSQQDLFVLNSGAPRRGQIELLFYLNTAELKMFLLATFSSVQVSPRLHADMLDNLAKEQNSASICSHHSCEHVIIVTVTLSRCMDPTVDVKLCVWWELWTLVNSVWAPNHHWLPF